MKPDLRAWTTQWWSGRGGFAGRALDVALWPAEILFARAAGARNAAYGGGLLHQARASIPVVSAGNLRVGGAGKTPVSAWIARRYSEWGMKPAVVMRGYGSDEVLVHREINPGIPVYLAPRRAEGVARAASDGCGVAVLDDGFQHRALARDLDIVLIATESWTARRRLLPRGPWRETLGALRRADFVLVTRKSAPVETAERIVSEVSTLIGRDSVAICALAPERLRALHDATDARELEWMQGRAILAVASLADPIPFVRQLEQLGATAELMDFADHHDFTSRDVESIQERAGGRMIVMTGKEGVKLRPLMAGAVPAMVVEQRVIIEAGEDQLLARLRQAVGI